MAWYWWVLIVIAAVAIAGLKLWFVPRWLKKRQEKRVAREKLAEDEDLEG